jgi:hypothetical protein
MGTYATTAHISARMSGRTFGANTSPSTTQIGVWIDEAEGALAAHLNAAQVSTPITNANGILLMQSWACDYAEGRTRLALASGGVDQSADDGQKLIDRFDARLKDILDKPATYSAMLNAGSAGDETRQIRAYVLDNDDDETIDDGDFDPTFTRDEVF